MKVTFISMTVMVMVAFTYQSAAQFAKPFPEGLGVEVGGGYNRATWQVFDAAQVYGGDKLTRDRFYLTPTVRVSYFLEPFERGHLVPFVEYNRFGGKHEPLPNGYQDEYWFDALGMGIVGTYSFSDFSVGPGVKVNRHLKVTGKSLGAVNVQSNEGETWRETDFTEFNRRWSLDLGGRIDWTFNHWSIATEAWFGLTQLQSRDLDPFVEIYQQHFRFLVGYRL